MLMFGGTLESGSHDFAICILKHPAKWSRKVQPICLPPPNEDFYGFKTVAAGWGMNQFDIFESTPTNLHKVSLTVDKKFSPTTLGTKLEKNSGGLYKDACAGDSGKAAKTLQIKLVQQNCNP